MRTNTGYLFKRANDICFNRIAAAERLRQLSMYKAASEDGEEKIGDLSKVLLSVGLHAGLGSVGSAGMSYLQNQFFRDEAEKLKGKALREELIADALFGGLVGSAWGGIKGGLLLQKEKEIQEGKS